MKLKFRHNNKELKDLELLNKYRDTGNIEYFQILFERYIPLIHGLALKYLKEPNSAQDVVIDLFENLHEKIVKYNIDNFNNWLYSVVKHHCFQLLKEKKKEILVDFDSQLMESDSVVNLFDEETNEEKEVALKKCLEKLPEPQKLSIILFFYEEKSYAEIVEETQYNLKSVKSYLQNGRRNLKICLEKSLEV